MTLSSDYKKTLFAPFKSGMFNLKNRIALAPMTRISATEGGCATDQMAAYYSNFAKYEFGLIETEGTYIDMEYSQGYRGQPGLANVDQMNHWRKVVNGVHKHNTPIFVQLMHAGALTQFNKYKDETIAPSNVQPKGQQMEIYGGQGSYACPRTMSLDEIKHTKENFVRAAIRAKDVGFDGIEIHGANGYLIDEFITTYTNKRKDEYGGNVNARIRFASEILAEIHEVIGSDLILGVRISQSKVNDSAYQWPNGESDAEIIFKALGQTGIDFIHVCGDDALAPVSEDGQIFADWAKKYSKLTVIGNGNLQSPQNAYDILNRGAADIIAIAKGALANPDWPTKVKKGKKLNKFDSKIITPFATLDNQSIWIRQNNFLDSWWI